MKSKFIVCFILSILFFASCKKKEPIVIENLTQANIQGTWWHNYVDYTGNDAFVLPPKLWFKFEADSFFMSINRFEDIIADTNGCGYLDWTEYAKGTYSLDNNLLDLNGVYCNGDFIIKQGGCYNTGQYADKFSGYFIGDTLYMRWAHPQATTISGREAPMYKK